MKRILTYFPIALVPVMMFMSCEKQPEKGTVVEFERNFYSLFSQKPLEIRATLSSPLDADLTLDLGFAGSATKGTDYEVSSETITFRAGETSSVITVSELTATDPETSEEIGLMDGKDIKISIIQPATGGDITLGNKSFAMISKSSEEVLVYSFSTDKAELMEKYTISVTLQNTDPNNDFAAPAEISVPLTFTYSDGLPESSVNTGSATITIPAGEDSGSLQIAFDDNGSNGTLTVSVDNASRFIPGKNGSVAIRVTGIPTASELCGKWDFSKVYALEELELWFMEMEDDPELLPTHNEGFSLVIGENGGKFSLKPEGTGDWMNYFRNCTMTPAKPFNTTDEAILEGQYSTTEISMFGVFDPETPVTGHTQLAYYELSSANRAFSSETEDLGKGMIAIRLTEDGMLEVSLRDYDQPPFGEMWWDGFDADMFGFTSLFEKAE